MYGIGTEVSPSSGRLETVIRSRNAIVARFPHPNDGPVELAGGTFRTGVNFHIKEDGNDDLDGLSWDTAKVTIGYGSDNKGAMNSVVSGRGDEIHIRPGDYTEPEILVDKEDLAIVGHGGEGAVGITPGSGIESMKITATDVRLINLRFEGDSTADYTLSVGTFNDDVFGFRAYGCMLRAGSGVGVIVKLHGCGDAQFSGGDIAWGGIGFDMVGNSSGFPTQIVIKGNHFHNVTVAHVRGTGGTGKVVNLTHKFNTHDVEEDGTEPTTFITVDHATSSGLITKNSFATATNSNSLFVIQTHVHWVANETEAGVSTTRPS